MTIIYDIHGEKIFDSENDIPLREKFELAITKNVDLKYTDLTGLTVSFKNVKDIDLLLANLVIALSIVFRDD
jgi:hypothetical protein